MERRQLLKRFDLDDHRVFHNQVKAVAAIELNVFINDRQWLLLLNAAQFEPNLSQFIRQTRFVSRLQQPWHPTSMYLTRRANDPARN